VRRSAYKPLPAEALSDVIEPLMVLRQGYRVVFEDRALAYEETTSNTRTEFQMRIRVVSRGMSAILAMSDLLDFRRWGWISFQLISHKVLRWLAPVFLIGMFLSSAVLAQTPFFRYALLLQVAFYLIAGLAALAPIHQRWKPLSIPLYFCTLNLAALMALINVIRGRKFVVWQTVR
jgi:cellulose synthase/poly-beta-1,6-N-acetylglucosamine synthase-like glycosyltransferase